jgi:iron complex outermembrane recepter protein
MSPKLRASIHRILFATGAFAATVTPVYSQETTEEIAEIVIVTGSYIRGTAEDAALPVDVISTEELEKQGAPSPVEMLKTLTVMTGIIGETNRFTAGRGQAQAGSTLMNLRGFGENRTLTLLNGKRLASNDVNLMPANAIARVEILKDGGASTYGSDAIAGVVNYITKERVDGLELSADYRHIEGSDGDYNGGISWGTTGERWDFFAAGNYFHRSTLPTLERDWAVRTFAENPEGGWSTASNPGNFTFTTPAGNVTVRDPSCTGLGGTVVGTGCRTQFTRWDNLVEEQETYQTFAQFNFDITDTTRLHVEGLYGRTAIDDSGSSPSSSTTRPITSTVFGGPAAFLSPASDLTRSPQRSNFFYVPFTNPGFQGAYAPGAGFVPATATGTGGYIQLTNWRPYLATGNPLYDNGGQLYAFKRDNARLAVELTGEIGEINWSTSANYGLFTSERREVDFSTSKLQLALRGLGGPNCTYATGTPGAGGCQWFNPFASGIAADRNGVANPNYVASADVNNVGLLRWLQDDMLAETETRLGEFNAVLSGELPISLPGGAIGWAAGAQYRHSWIELTNGDTTNRDTNPCVDTPINGTTSCAPYGESPYNFLATYNQIDVDRGVYAAFVESSLPILDSLNAQVAARFEDYGDQGGSSFDPKLSMKYQIIDQLAIRGSVGTTFRAPPQTSLIADERIGFTTIFGSSRPTATVGNPDLEPEESFQWNVGLISQLGGFRATVDYWSFDIDKLLTVEPTSGIVSLVFPTAPSTANPNPANNCATVDPAFLASRFQFTAGCDPNGILKLTRSEINGAGIKNSGVDVSMDYTFDNLFGGSMVLGASGTWIREYKTSTLVVDGVVFERGFDGTGFLNQGTTLFAMPEWRAQAYVDFNFATHNVRWTANFVDQYRDQRDGINRDGRVESNIFTATSPTGRVIDSVILHNLTYRTELPFNTTLFATIDNVFDEDPSFARLDLSYDPLTGFPLGRTFKLGARVNFE